MHNSLTVLFVVIHLVGVAQVTSSKSYGSSRFTENHYGPFHRTIKDTIPGGVSRFGHYASISPGIGNLCGRSAFGGVLSYSLAYKSLLFSLTYSGASTIGGGGPYYYSARYSGILFGESLRFKNLLLSLSTGVAISGVVINSPYFERYEMISVPIELKCFLLAHNGIGFGVHYSQNIILQAPYSPFNFGFSIVSGHWNKSKRKK